LSASLLLILNEDSKVLSFKIVPNDKREYLVLLLKEIWSNHKEQQCQACYTDNVKVDAAFVNQAHAECFPNDPVDPTMLLDVFHAKNRVVSEMLKTHPDFKAANSDLSSVLHELKFPRSYPDENDFVEALSNWIKEYSSVHASLALSINDRIRFFGKTIDFFEFKLDFRLEFEQQEEAVCSNTTS